MTRFLLFASFACLAFALTAAIAQDQKNDFKAVISINGKTVEFTDRESAKKAFKELGLPDPFEQIDGIMFGGPGTPPDPLELETGVVIKIPDKAFAKKFKSAIDAAGKPTKEPRKLDFDLSMDEEESEAEFFNAEDLKPMRDWLNKWLVRQRKLIRDRKVSRDAPPFVGEETVVMPIDSTKDANALLKLVTTALGRPGTLADAADRSEVLFKVMVTKEWAAIVFPQEQDMKKAKPVAQPWSELVPKRKQFPGGNFGNIAFGNPLFDPQKRIDEMLKKMQGQDKVKEQPPKEPAPEKKKEEKKKEKA